MLVRQRLARLLTWKRARLYALVLAFTYLYAWGLVVFQGRPALSSSDEPIGGDYVAFYAAGRVLLSGDGAHLYDKTTLMRIQEVALQGRIPDFYDAYRNPPFFALVFAPLSVLDLVPSFVVWSVLSLAMFVVALRLLCDVVPGMEGRWRGLTVVAFAFAPVYFGLIDGQNSMLALLLFVVLYRSLLRGEDRLAGVVAALGLFKPQLFFVFPLLFLVSRRWQALGAYVVTALVLALISFAVVGVDGMYGWLRILLDLETNNAQKLAWRMHSIKGFFDLLLPGQTALSWAFYAVASLGLLGFLARAWRHARSITPPLWIVTSVVVALVDPHLVDYDLTVLVPAGVLLAVYVPNLRWLMLALFPLLIFRVQVPLGPSAVQITTLVLLAATIFTWRQARPLPEASPEGALLSAQSAPLPRPSSARLV